MGTARTARAHACGLQQCHRSLWVSVDIPTKLGCQLLHTLLPFVTVCTSSSDRSLFYDLCASNCCQHLSWQNHSVSYMCVGDPMHEYTHSACVSVYIPFMCMCACHLFMCDCGYSIDASFHVLCACIIVLYSTCIDIRTLMFVHHGFACSAYVPHMLSLP